MNRSPWRKSEIRHRAKPPSKLYGHVGSAEMKKKAYAWLLKHGEPPDTSDRSRRKKVPLKKVPPFLVDWECDRVD